VILSGIGGQGKTQLAIEYCRQAQDSKMFSAIFWVQASKEAVAKKDLETICDIIKAPDKIFQSADEKVNYVRQTMSLWPRPWLLVFDNYDDPDSFNNIRTLIPSSPHGSVLITSRYAGSFSWLGCAFKLGGLQEQEAVDLLFLKIEGSIKKTEGNIESAKQIVHRLGYLALAVSQAGAYIRARPGITLEEFLKIFEEEKITILANNRDGVEYTSRGRTEEEVSVILSVYTTWEISFNLLRNDNSLWDITNDRQNKGQILTMFACFNAQNVSLQLFTAPRTGPKSLVTEESETRQEGGNWLQPLLTDDSCWNLLKFDNVLEEFHQLSLIEDFALPPDRGFRQFSIHPLVKDWIRLRPTGRPHSQTCLLQAVQILINCLSAHFDPGEFSLPEHIQQEIPQHLAACEETFNEFKKSKRLSNPVLVNTTLDKAKELTVRLEKEQLEIRRQRWRCITQWLNGSEFPEGNIEQFGWLQHQRISGAGDWFLDSEKFKLWKDRPNQTLWCSGIGEESWLNENV
jgi:hypothetical protein